MILGRRARWITIFPRMRLNLLASRRRRALVLLGRGLRNRKTILERIVAGVDSYLGMRVKLWMETFAPARARSPEEKKMMVISSNRWIVASPGMGGGMGNRRTSSTGGRFRG